MPQPSVDSKVQGSVGALPLGSVSQSSVQELRHADVSRANWNQFPAGFQCSECSESPEGCLSFAGEASASTMWDNNAWIFFYDNSTEGEPPFLIQDFIHAFQPNAKLIVMLRDPVER